MELNRIYNENCLDTMARMPSGLVNLVVTSPPYNMRTRIRNGQYTTRERSGHFSKKYAHFGDDLPIADFYKQHRQIIKELLRVSPMVLYNIQIVTGSKEAFFKLIGTFRKYIKDIIDWEKDTEQPAMHGQVLNAAHELILVMQSPAEAGRALKYANFERGTLSNHWKGMGRGETFDGHGATFPLNLARTCINKFSKVGDVVYDPFSGLGSTAIAAHQLERQWIGSEISSEYVELANKRLAPYLAQKTLFAAA